MGRNIPAFTPELAGAHDVQAYLREIDFYLQSWTSVNHQDRLYLLWITCSPEVRRFLSRQPGHIQSDYQQLKQAIINHHQGKDLLEQNSAEEYCEGQTSNSSPDATQHQTSPREEHPLKTVDTPEAARQRWMEQWVDMPKSETFTNTTQSNSSRCRHKSNATPQTLDFW